MKLFVIMMVVGYKFEEVKAASGVVVEERKCLKEDFDSATKLAFKTSEHISSRSGSR